MPVTPMGFRPPELFPHAKPGRPFGAPCPPAVGRRERLDSKASGRTWVRCFDGLIQDSTKPDALLGFHPLQGLPLSRDGTPNGFLLSWASPRSTHSSVRGHPPEFCSAGELAGLSRVCLPSWGLSPPRSIDPPAAVQTRLRRPLHPMNEMSKSASKVLPVDRATGRRTCRR
jgi:hypothetical protein